MEKRFYMGGLEPLAEREVGVVASTAQLGRDGHIVEPSGIDLTAYRKNAIVLWSHSPEDPVGVTTAIGVRDGALAARIEFAPLGISALADQCCSLVKAGVVKAVSIGFQPLQSVPIDRNDPRAGRHITSAELLEISFVSIPADTGALVVERAAPPIGMIGFSALRPVPRAAIERAAARVPRSRGGLIMSPTNHVWSLLEAKRRDDEQRFGRAARQRDLDRLRERGRRLGIS